MKTVADLRGEIEVAEAKGDFDTAMALKSEWLSVLRRKGEPDARSPEELEAFRVAVTPQPQPVTGEGAGAGNSEGKGS
ncbi:MAG: hypothetical protein WD651_02560 [Acidimicrobiia bacterium]